MFNSGSLSLATNIVRTMKIIVVALWEVSDALSRSVTDECAGSNIFSWTVWSDTRAVGESTYECWCAIFALAIFFVGVVLLPLCIAIGPWPLDGVFMCDHFRRFKSFCARCVYDRRPVYFYGMRSVVVEGCLKNLRRAIGFPRRSGIRSRQGWCQSGLDPTTCHRRAARVTLSLFKFVLSLSLVMRTIVRSK